MALPADHALMVWCDRVKQSPYGLSSSISIQNRHSEILKQNKYIQGADLVD
jgi:hypothetical protein